MLYGDAMKCRLLKFILIGIFALSLHAQQIKRNDAIRIALRSIKIAQDEATILSPVPRDSFRLRLVDVALAKPTKLPDIADSLLAELSGKTYYKLIKSLAKILDLSPKQPVVAKKIAKHPWDNYPKMSPKIKRTLSAIYDAILASTDNLTIAYSKLDSAQLDTVLTMPIELLSPFERRIDNQINAATALEKDIVELEQENREVRFFELAQRVNQQKIFDAAKLVFQATLNAISQLKTVTSISGTLTVPDTMAFGDIIYYAETEIGPVIVGGVGPTFYLGPFAIIIDLGGDDNYLYHAGGTTPKIPVAISIDLGGNDLYWSDDKFSFGSALGGVGILYDAEGNDIYRVNNMSLGCGIFGWGILWDHKGDDTYIGSGVTIGAAFMGGGVLIDDSGFDKYQSNIYSQGFGGTKGIGLLLDKSGNDSYTCTGNILDRLHYADHYLSLSQGVGYGYRPIASGGVGILMDFDGNDVYSAEIFAQGASYWLGFGLLYDRNGNDQYNSFQYSQGSAAHLGIGVLIDENGDDTYASTGMSQGCGDDLAAGCLNDRSGDDSYLVRDISQGAGNANGIGLLIDEGNGDDRYLAGNEYNVRGYGNWRKEFGSIGIMLDLGGDDSYNGKGKNGAFWSNSSYGVGIDFPPKQ